MKSDLFINRVWVEAFSGASLNYRIIWNP